VKDEMAREWAEVPAYVDSLEKSLGAGSAPKLFEDFDRDAAGMRDMGRRMFERWVDVAVAAHR